MEPTEKQAFTPDEVASLNGYQNWGRMHPFTCGGGGGPCSGTSLIATAAGWRCPACDYTQDWAHNWMKDWGWKKLDIAEPLAPSIEDQIAYLLANGWEKISPTIWASPAGRLFRGPHGAWLVAVGQQK